VKKDQGTGYISSAQSSSRMQGWHVLMTLGGVRVADEDVYI